jgi:hypothetical protein
MDSHPVRTLPRVLKSFRKFSDLPSRFCGFTEIKICTSVGPKTQCFGVLKRVCAELAALREIVLRQEVQQLQPLADADARIMLLEESQHILVIESPLLPARPEAPVQATHPTSVDPIEEEVGPSKEEPCNETTSKRRKRLTSAITPEDLTVESGPRQPLRAPGEWHQTGKCFYFYIFIY